MRRKLSRSFKDAFAGLFYCFRTQRNMVIHLVAGVLVLAAGFLLDLDALKQVILLGAIFMVIIMETVNTAVEKAVDSATREYSRDAYLAKVVAASAVLLSVFFAVLIGIIILGPPLLSLVV